MQLQISQPPLRISKTDRHKLVFDVQTHHVSRHLKSNDLAVIGCTDAAQGDRADGSSTGGYVMTMAPYRPFNEGHMTDTSLVGWSTNKPKRVARSSVSAEIQQACNTDRGVFPARQLCSCVNGNTVTKHSVTEAVKIVGLDAIGVHNALHHSSSTALGLTEKRSGIELLGRKDSIEEHDTDLWWCDSEIQLADGRTKKTKICRILSFLRAFRKKFVLDSTYTSAR